MHQCSSFKSSVARLMVEMYSFKVTNYEVKSTAIKTKRTVAVIQNGNFCDGAGLDLVWGLPENARTVFGTQNKTYIMYLLQS